MNVWYKLIRLSRRSRVQTRLIVSFFLLSIIPLCITGILAYNKSVQSIHAKTSTYSTEIMTLLKNKVSDETQKYETLGDQLMLNKRIQDGLVRFDQMSEVERSTLQVYIETVLRDNFWIFSTIKSMQIQKEDGRILYDYGYGSLQDQDIERLRNKAKQSGLIDTWSYGTTTGGESCLTLVRRMTALDDSQGTLGYLILGINEQLFAQSTYSGADLGDGSEIVILNGAGELLSSKTDMFHSGHTLQVSDPLYKLVQSNQSQDVSLNSGHYFASYVHDDALDWYMIGLIPYTYLNAESYDIAFTIAVVIAVCLIFILMMTTFISTSISFPLKKLNSATNQVMNGNIKVVIRDDGQDEIGFLSLKFNQMMLKLDQLIEEVKDEQTKKREAELSMLQAQINPHFLFNTLNSLKWAAVLSQANSVSDGLGALAELLRNTIVHKDEQVTLRDELRNISNYMVIQQVRYGTSLQTVYQIDEDLMDAQILKFLLQPIVENAIIHGFEGGQREPRIIISAERFGNDLRISIHDNGKGIAPEKVQQLLNTEANSSHKRLASIGMSNVRERIKIHFGEYYGLDISSEEGSGTNVVIVIPYVNEKVSDSHA